MGKRRAVPVLGGVTHIILFARVSLGGGAFGLLATVARAKDRQMKRRRGLDPGLVLRGRDRGSTTTKSARGATFIIGL